MGQSDAFNGPQRAKVVDVDDPNGLLRVSIRLVGIWDAIADANLPWAERTPSDSGAYSPLLAGDYVWVDFPYDGDSKRPRVIGRATDSPDGVPNFGAEVSGQGTAYTQKTVEGAPDAGTVTPGKDYVYDRNGLLEIRNASGSWSVTHKSSGTTMGMNDSGQLYISSQLTLFVHSVGDTTIKSEGNTSVESKGNMSIESEGDLSINAAGALSIKGASVAIDKA